MKTFILSLLLLVPKDAPPIHVAVNADPLHTFRDETPDMSPLVQLYRQMSYELLTKDLVANGYRIVDPGTEPETVVLEQYEIPSVQPSDEDATLHVLISRTNAHEGNFTVNLELETAAGDRLSAPFLTCEGHCAPQTLVESIVDSGVVYQLLEDSVRSVQPEPPPPILPPPASSPPRASVQDAPKRIGPAGWTGIGLLPVGIALTTVGAVAFRPAPSGADAMFRSSGTYRSTGTDAALGIGISSLIVGAALIAIDQTVLKRRRHAN